MKKAPASRHTVGRYGVRETLLTWTSLSSPPFSSIHTISTLISDYERKKGEKKVFFVCSNTSELTMQIRRACLLFSNKKIIYPQRHKRVFCQKLIWYSRAGQDRCWRRRICRSMAPIRSFLITILCLAPSKTWCRDPINN